MSVDPCHLVRSGVEDGDGSIRPAKVIKSLCLEMICHFELP